MRNRLDPATTERLVCVYSNSKLVALSRDVDKLKILLPPGDRARPGAPRSRGAHFGARRRADGRRAGAAAVRTSVLLPRAAMYMVRGGARHQTARELEGADSAD